MDRHREIAERVGAALAERDDVLAVLIAGSVCRGEHVATSDVDLLVVTTEDSSLEVAPRRLVDGLLVEWIARPEPDWLAAGAGLAGPVRPAEGARLLGSAMRGVGTGQPLCRP